jgi:ABC-type branched-subunit amino acid transport system substrate-binding protein
MGVIVACLATAGCSVLVKDEEPRVAKVVALFPDSRQHAAASAGAREAIDLAMADLEIGGWDIVVEHVDEADDVASIVSEIASDRDVIAVVGGMTTSSVRGAQARLDRATIPFISPADVELAHTRGGDLLAPQRPYESYFRTAVPDADPLDLAAEYAVSGLNAEQVVIISDDRPDQASAVARQVRQLGASAVIGAPDGIADLVDEAVGSEEVTAFYAAGGADLVGEIVDAVTSAGLDAEVIGGAELTGSDLGAIAVHVAAVEPAVLSPTRDVPVPGATAPSAHGAAAHDAATAVRRTLERCLPPASGDARSARAGCLSELGVIAFEGITGHVAFDQFGDRPGARPYVVVSDAQGWLPVGS